MNEIINNENNMSASNFKLQIHPKICTSIAKEYVDNIYKVFLEYIDNAIDSAEDEYDENKEEYRKDIKIKVTFDGNNIDIFRVFIEDNCKGIPHPEKIFMNIGNSSKAKINNQNGQFGYGINSFLAVCSKLSVTSKVSENQHSKKITVTKEDYEDPNRDLILEDNPGFTFTFNLGNSFTRFTLEDFLPDKFSILSEAKLKDEIEKHFEPILRRKGLEIKIHTRSNTLLHCKPFDYSKYKEHSFERNIDEVFYTSNKKLKKTSKINISDNPLLIRIYVSKDKAINRKPFLIVNGRRIQDVSDIDGFRSYLKSHIWSHPNVTGYIDAKNHLTPKMGRSDVTSDSKLTKAIYNTILSVEDEIKKVVSDTLNINITRKFKKLETILSQATSNIIKANIGSLFNSHERPLKGDYQECSASKDKYVVFDNQNLKRNCLNCSKGSTKTKAKTNKTNNPAEDNSKATGFLADPNDFSNTKPGKLDNAVDNSPNISISMDYENTPPLDENSKPIRSSFYEGTIIIYGKHDEFVRRQSTSRDLSPKISSSLLSYINNEILFQVFNLLDDPKLSQKELLKLFVDSSNDLEEALKEYIDKDLNELIQS